MRTLLSLPPNLVADFHKLTGMSQEEYFCTSDPVDKKLGSGGGTTWLLDAAYRHDADGQDFMTWLSSEKRILLHAGGQSRRLPAYAPSGKVLTPIPVFRWARGQRIDQTLLHLQMPLYERIMQKAPASHHTLIASGDVMLRATEPLQDIPEADVICYGLWADSTLCSHHGTFLMARETPTQLDFMLQKPTVDEQSRVMQTHLMLMDIGIWLLSDRAVEVLNKRATGANGEVKYYDLYSTFGCCLGAHPSQQDEEVQKLSVCILPLPGGEFYHFGTTPELLTSTLAIQNLVKDQRLILHRDVKKQSSLFTQNSLIYNRLDEKNDFVWVENSHLGEGWHLTKRNVVTGVPKNDWQVTLPEGVCVDVVPVGEDGWALRPYGWNDAFRGDVANERTRYLGQSFVKWNESRKLTVKAGTDIQSAPIFPVCKCVKELGLWLNWYLAENPGEKPTAERFMSADELSAEANLARLFAQRDAMMREDLKKLSENWTKSVFYQSDLTVMREKYDQLGLKLPPALPESAPLALRIHDAMFRAKDDGDRTAYELLRQGLTEQALNRKVTPQCAVLADQIVWGRSPVRIDVAGGWTDTAPYSLYKGGNVVNVAVELNGQPPLQVYVKPCKEPVVICRSIDLGAMERIETYEELGAYNKVGSPFSIPKAALTLCGFMPGFCSQNYGSLKEQLQDFGCGIEITLLAAIPAGSGLGTSSILGSTVLAALNNFCSLGWGRHEICDRTLILEQLLTTGGGWQDQYGGVFGGVKLLQSISGFQQNVTVRWLPDTIFTNPDYSPLHLLYYTGITRTAKHILAEIVRNMFLNNGETLCLLDEMREHALTVNEVLQKGQMDEFGKLLRRTWQQNCLLDSGTNPPAVQELCDRIDDYCAGYKLPGAGGGGYLYMVAKDEEAARRIRHTLTENPLAPTARFVDMKLSKSGVEVSRS